MGSGYPAMGMVWVGFARTLGRGWVRVLSSVGRSKGWVAQTLGRGSVRGAQWVQ
jgi:hypothetical protein